MKTRVSMMCATAALVLAVSACGDPSGPSPRAVLTVTRDTIVASPPPSSVFTPYLNFTVPFTLTNASESSIEVNQCSASVDELVDGEWRQAWTITCALPGSIPGQARGIAPGATDHFEISINAEFDAGINSSWQGTQLPGRYRFQTTVRTLNGRSVVATAVSNAFTLVRAEN